MTFKLIINSPGEECSGYPAEGPEQRAVLQAAVGHSWFRNLLRRAKLISIVSGGQLLSSILKKIITCAELRAMPECGSQTSVANIKCRAALNTAPAHKSHYCRWRRAFSQWQRPSPAAPQFFAASLVLGKQLRPKTSQRALIH